MFRVAIALFHSMSECFSLKLSGRFFAASPIISSRLMIASWIIGDPKNCFSVSPWEYFSMASIDSNTWCRKIIGSLFTVFLSVLPGYDLLEGDEQICM